MNSTLLQNTRLASFRDWKTTNDPQLVWTTSFGLVVLVVLYLIAEARKSNSKVQRPPHVGSWVPWLGSGIHLATNPDRFFDSAIRNHGPVFSLTAVGKKMIYVTSPILIAQVYANPKTFDFPLIRRHMQMHIFGQSKEADHDLEEELFPAHSRQLQPGTIGPLVSSFVDHLGTYMRNWVDKVEESGGLTITEPGKIHHVMSISTLTAIMGTTFPATRFLPIFNKFDAEFTKLAGELPAWMCRDAVKNREACLDILEKWYIGYNKRSEAGTLKPGEPVSAVIQAVLDFSRDHATATRDVATFLLADMFATQANAPPAAAWCVIKFTENPEALARLRREIRAGLDTCGSLDKLVRDKKVLDSEFEFLGSAIKETLRLVTSVASIRRVVQDTILPADKSSSEGVLLKRGEMIYCLTRPTHTDPTIHRGADEWVPERFTPAYRVKGEGKAVKNDWMPFGGGSSMCEGRHFALQELRIFLVTFFYHFDVEAVGREQAQIDFSRGSGAGVMPPKGSWGIRVARRADTA